MELEKAIDFDEPAIVADVVKKQEEDILADGEIDKVLKGDYEEYVSSSAEEWLDDEADWLTDEDLELTEETEVKCDMEGEENVSTSTNERTNGFRRFCNRDSLAGVYHGEASEKSDGNVFQEALMAKAQVVGKPAQSTQGSAGTGEAEADAARVCMTAEEEAVEVPSDYEEADEDGYEDTFVMLNPKESAEVLIQVIHDLEVNSEFFVGKNDGKAYVTWQDCQGNVATDEIESSLFELKFGAELRNACYTLWQRGDVRKAIYSLASHAHFSRKRKDVYGRIGKVGDTIYYNLEDAKQRIVSISPAGVHIMNAYALADYSFAFKGHPHMAEQRFSKKRAEKSLFEMLAEFVNLGDKEKVLLIVTILTWFIEDVPKAIILLQGEQGTGKTVLSTMIQAIVDPVNHNVLSIPGTKEDLSVALSSHYVLAVDNLSSLNSGVSDLFCQAATGGSVLSRTKFTNYSASIATFKNCLILNGITIANAKPDLLDRTLVFEMKSLTNQYGSVSDLFAKIHEKMPSVMTEIFYTLSDALRIYPTLDAGISGRMYDYLQWGRAISIAMFGSDAPFLDAYKAQKALMLSDVIEQNTFVSLLKQYLDSLGDSKFPLDINPTNLYKQVSTLAFKNGVPMNGVGWPKTPQTMSSTIKRYMPALRSMGYEFVIDARNKKGGVRYISIGKC